MALSFTQQTELSDRYAKALFELAEAAKKLDVAERDLKVIEAALEASPALKSVVNNPILARAAIGKALDAVLAHLKVSDITRRLARVMAYQRRLPLLPSVNEAFFRRLHEARGETVVEVTTADELKKEMAKKLETLLADRLGSKVILKRVVDKDVLGGMRIRIGSKMIDATLAAKLDKLTAHLKRGIYLSPVR